MTKLFCLKKLQQKHRKRGIRSRRLVEKRIGAYQFNYKLSHQVSNFIDTKADTNIENCIKKYFYKFAFKGNSCRMETEGTMLQLA